MRKIVHQQCWHVRTTEGEEIVPYELCTERSTLFYFLDGDFVKGEKPKVREGFYVKKPNVTGYDDCTAWDGPFETRTAAVRFRGE